MLLSSGYASLARASDYCQQSEGVYVPVQAVWALLQGPQAEETCFLPVPLRLMYGGAEVDMKNTVAVLRLASAEATLCRSQVSPHMGDQVFSSIPRYPARRHTAEAAQLPA